MLSNLILISFKFAILLAIMTNYSPKKKLAAFVQ